MDIFSHIIGLIFLKNQMIISRNEIIMNAHQEVVREVMMGESGGKEDAKNPNDGGSLSLGCLQFKEKTFLEKVKKFELFSQADEADLKNLWADCWAQKLVMSYMLETEDKPLCHWQNTSKSLRKYKC